MESTPPPTISDLRSYLENTTLADTATLAGNDKGDKVRKHTIV